MLLFLYGGKWIETEAFEAFLDEYMADAMHGCVDEFDVGRRVGYSRKFPVLHIRGVVEEGHLSPTYGD